MFSAFSASRLAFNFDSIHDTKCARLCQRIEKLKVERRMSFASASDVKSSIFRLIIYFAVNLDAQNRSALDKLELPGKSRQRIARHSNVRS